MPSIAVALDQAPKYSFGRGILNALVELRYPPKGAICYGWHALSQKTHGDEDCQSRSCES